VSSNLPKSVQPDKKVREEGEITTLASVFRWSLEEQILPNTAIFVSKDILLAQTSNCE